MLEQPNPTYSEDLYRFHWPSLGVEIILERFSESKDDVRAEATVTLDHHLYGGRLYSGRLLLIGSNSRRDVRRELEGRTGGQDNPDFDWAGMLEQACNMARERYRRGEPIVDLAKVDFRERPRFLLEPFIVDSGISVPYGDGKTAKSIFVLRCCAQLALEKQIPSLYLDWEDDQETHAERLAAICTGMGVDVSTIEDMIHYQRRATRLQDSAREIRRSVAELGVGHVVVDSLGMAAGDPNDHGLMIEAVRAARSLGVACSCIHHLPKDAKDKTKPFGSVYASNEARLTWLFEKVQEEGSDELSLLLTNQAFNRGKLQPKRAFKVRFTNDGDLLVCVEFDEVPVGQLEAFRKNLPQHVLIAEILKANGLMTSDDIATALNADGVEISAKVVGAVLRRYRDRKFVQVDQRWALRAPSGREHVRESETGVAS